MDSLCRVRNKIMYVLSWWTVSVLTRALFWHLLPSLLPNFGNKHQNNPLVSAETIRHSSTYIILNEHGENIMDKSHKSHNAPVLKRKMHHIGTLLFQHGVLWDMGQVYCGIYEIGLFSIPDFVLYPYKITPMLMESGCHNCIIFDEL